MLKKQGASVGYGDSGGCCVIKEPWELKESSRSSTAGAPTESWRQHIKPAPGRNHVVFKQQAHRGRMAQGFEPHPTQCDPEARLPKIQCLPYWLSAVLWSNPYFLSLSLLR